MDGHRSRVLIVDDEEPLLLNLAAAVRSRGHDADTAVNGLAALDKLGQHSYQLVVTDLRMPDLAGPEFLIRMRESGWDTPVVVITGYATLEAAVDCLRRGAADFLIKPFEVEEFLASVEKALARSASPQGRVHDWEKIRLAYGLTRRQRQVLEAFHATGKTNRDLAQELNLSTHTVKSHLKAAFQRMGVASRTQLLQVLAKAGR